MERKPARWSYWLGQVLAWGFGLVFIWAGVIKVQDPALFVISVRTFQLLPDPFAAWMALSLPWLEILAGLAVLTGLLRRGGLLLLNFSLVVFAAALISAWVRGLNVECGCFGGKPGATPIIEALARDAALLAWGLWLAWWHRRRK